MTKAIIALLRALGAGQVSMQTGSVDDSVILARIARMTAMGQLVASIGHEVNQPLMAIVTNADACLSWLASDRPQLDQARQAAERIVRDGHRAGDIIKSIRALARKATPEMTQT